MSEPATPEQFRLLFEKRCEVYSRVSALLMDLDEALDRDDAPRARYLIDDARRSLRSALAFLTDEVYDELERVEALAGALPSQDGAPMPPGLADELGDRLQLLHVKLARILKQPHLQDLEQVVGLSGRLRRRLEDEGRSRGLKARARALEDECLRREVEARELVGQKSYGRAAKVLRKAIRLDPERAVYHNDLGVVLSLLGRSEEAVEAYRTAVTLNERLPARRTEEWTTSYYNLGVALRKAAVEALADDAGRALEGFRQARAAFVEFTRVHVSGAKVHDAARAIEQIDQEIGLIEANAAG